MWTDSHCHVPYEGVGIDAVLRATEAGVTRFVTIGTSVESSRAAIAACREGRSQGLAMWATVGLHPHDATAGLSGLEELLSEPEVVAVGECGLDYHYDHSPRDAQREVFAAQVRLARQHDLALVVHTRDAWDDTLAILDAVGTPPRTVIHCFTGGPAEAAACLARGCHLSFSGIVTVKNAAPTQQAARECPLERMLVETDSPYLAPVPHRGKPNEPAWVAAVGAAIAALREMSASELARITSANAERVFALT